MRRPWFAIRYAAAGLAAACLIATPAVADRDCNVPLADWQPREALQKKLEAEGWTVLSIRSDDGCYKVRATNAQGARLKAKFDPARLERVTGRDDDD
ncbi:PepSY domain-containing protein [Xanthobacter autotrophicus]|uniref:PepSY domain-containing protein n=1 Tax=Xanthobacter TaxID=279 RepID=UPI0024AC06B8|nr:PepSY domain-containing protein [Xanthobacter autotrophicus]MDI4665498.1 PepSY domain-containing protein [Xanthobacter autotrophicus]